MSASSVRTRRALGTLLAFMSLNALGGGWYGLAGAEGVPVAWLEGSSFASYVIPSLVLIVAVGGTSAVASALLFSDARIARPAAMAAGVVMLGWIAAQLAIIGYVSWLQPAVAIVGVIVVATSLRLPRQR